MPAAKYLKPILIIIYKLILQNSLQMEDVQMNNADATENVDPNL